MGNFRVELPIQGKQFGGFETREFALRAAREMASELKVLVLVWSFAGAFHCDRIDGRVAA